MPAYILNIKQVQRGHTQSTGSVVQGITGATEINQVITRNPGDISVPMDIVSEAQLRGIVQYAALVQGEANTSSVETAITALL